MSKEFESKFESDLDSFSDESNDEDFTQVQSQKACKPRLHAIYESKTLRTLLCHRKLKPPSLRTRRRLDKPKAPTAAKVATYEPDVIATPTSKKLQRLPPLFIHNKDQWSEIRKQCESKSIVISKTHNTARGLRVQPAAILDFRNLSDLLATLKIAYHTDSLKER
ncbi:hypothetical protein EVAR_9280_1 [Eumeta japonica]|uniref:Uncharacterized protein n=1 Tax=Eumeta variegata TaxID=151549 RepID=A0A4C1TNJ7_EUMVA|nr:hypothetical protein EVAR_9280_1 [Eumeta japonica]